MPRTLITIFAVFVLLSVAAEARASCENDDRECQDWFVEHPPEPMEIEADTERLCAAGVATYGHRFRALRGQDGPGWHPAEMGFIARITRLLALVTCEAVANEAVRQGFDPLMAIAIAAQESHFDPGTIGAGGEVGPLQVKPRYHCGEDEHCEDLNEAIAGGIAYLVSLRERAAGRGDAKLLGAYHCGWGGAGGSDPGVPYRCYTYVEEVLARISAIRRRTA